MATPEEQIQLLQEQLKLLQANDKQVMAASAKLPPFWTDRPSVWFGQVEAQFEISGITQERTKYNYVVAALETRVAGEISDIIENPPKEDRYQYLKTELIKRLSASRKERLRRLLGDEDIGDRKPSQFLRHLRGLAGSVLKCDDIIRQLWISRLSTSIQSILATHEDLPLEKAAEMADKIAEVASPVTVQAVQGPSSEMAVLLSRIEALEARTGNSRSRSRPRGTNVRTRSVSRSSDRLCWYHFRFGKNAKRCISPCNWERAENRLSSQ